MLLRRKVAISGAGLLLTLAGMVIQIAVHHDAFSAGVFGLCVGACAASLHLAFRQIREEADLVRLVTQEGDPAQLSGAKFTS